MKTSIVKYQNKYVVIKLKGDSTIYKSQGLVAVVGRLVKITLEPDPENEYEDIVRCLIIRDVDEKNIEVPFCEVERVLQF